MKARKIHLFTDQGRNHPNQDAVGHAGNVIWVLDGATPLFGDDLLFGNDVQTVMQMLNQALMDHYVHDESPAWNLLHACLQVQAYCRSHVKNYDQIPPYALVTFAAAIAAIQEDRFDYCILGDCEIRYGKDGLLKDSSFAHVEARNKKDADAILARYHVKNIAELSETDHRKAHDEILKKDRFQRSLLNTAKDGGYWIGSLDGIGIAHSLCGTAPLSKGERVIVYCDGAAHLIPYAKNFMEAENPAEELMPLRKMTDDDVSLVWSDEEKS